MPPEDPLFDTPVSELKSNGDGSEPTSDPAPAVGLTREELNEGIEKVVGGLQEQVGELSQAIARMNQPAPAAVEPTPTETETDFLTAFSQNPEGAIDARIAAGLKGIAPVIYTGLESAGAAHVDNEVGRIDKEFGAGAWEKFYQKPMDEIVGMYKAKNPTALGDRNLIRREVDGLTGRMVGKLVEHQQEAKDTVEKEGLEKLSTIQENILKEAASRTSLTGGIRRIPTAGEEVTEDLKGYLAEREASIGLEQDPKDFLKTTDYGNTLEDYVAHQEKLGGGSK